MLTFVTGLCLGILTCYLRPIYKRYKIHTMPHDKFAEMYQKSRPYDSIEDGGTMCCSSKKELDKLFKTLPGGKS